MSGIVVTNDPVNPGQQPYARGPVHIKLITGTDGGAGYTSTGSIIGTFTTQTDASGNWSATLTPNSQLTPANTHYEVNEGGAVSLIVVPDSGGPYLVGSLLVTPPPTPAAPGITGVQVAVGGTVEGVRPEVNLIAGSGMTVSAVDNPGAGRVDVTLSSSGSAPVTSVNNRTGAVALAASDVNAVPTSAEGAANGVATLDAGGHLTSGQDANLLKASQLGANSGVASLDVNGHLTAVQAALLLAAASNLSDLASAPTARANLGLGGAATLSVGAGAGTVAAGDDSRITGAAQKSANLSDLGSASTARTNLGLAGAAVLNVGTSTGTVAAGDDSRITGAAQKAQNLADLASAPTARTNLGLGGAATLNVGAAAGTVAAGNDARITGALQAANSLSDVASAPSARTNLGLGTSAQQNAGSAVGVLAEMLPMHQCAVSGGSALTTGVLILNLIRPNGPILVTNLLVWLTLAGVTANGANGLALYSEAGNLIDQTADLSTAFASAGVIEAPLSLGAQQLAANTSYYVGVLTHFGGTTPKAGAALAGQAIPVAKGHYLSLTKTSTATFPASFTPSSLSISTAAYYLAMS